MIRISFRTLFVFVFAFVLAACNTTTDPVYVGILAAEDPSPSIAAEQKEGYRLGQEDADFSLLYKAETALQDEIQKSIRGMIEDDTTPVVAIVGATKNQGTNRAAALVNFLNAPMVIPTANGDNLLPANNRWTFRLSAPGSAFSGYLFGEILTRSNINSLGIDPELLQHFKIAILYEQNTYGEAAAVAAAESAMAQMVEIDEARSLYGMEIAVYDNFPDQNPDSDSLTNLAVQVKDQGVQLVYLVSSDPVVAQRLVQAFQAEYALDETPLPLFIGQSGGFASQAFMQTPEAQDVTILRQQWNHERCPAEVTSAYAGQSYGALYLLNHAIDVAREGMPQKRFSLNTASKRTEQLIQFRERVRDALKQTSLDVPCVGRVSFDPTGQNKEPVFELVEVTDGVESILSSAEFLDALEQRILISDPDFYAMTSQ